jgi:signal peptidase I
VRGVLGVLWRLLAIFGVVAVAFGVLWYTGYLVPLQSAGTSSMAPTIPACDGRTLAEGFTYRFRDPHRGELVAFHASGTIGGPVTPDSDSRDLSLTKRVVAIPGDHVVGRDGKVYVNDFMIDEIETAPFPRVNVSTDEYFVLGDNRSFSQDSRDFGSVPRDAIFGRVFMVYWPLGDLGSPELRHAGPPPGAGLCN